MEHKFSLEHLTALPFTPPELVNIAAEAGYDYVGLRTMPLGVAGEPECDIAHNSHLMRQTRQALSATGLSVSDVEVVRIAGDVDPLTYEPSFAAAAEIGATDVTASVWTPNLAYASDSLEALCQLARPYGLRINLEFVATASVSTLAGVLGLLRSSESENIGVLLDTYHFHRAATDLAELDDVPAEWWHFYQLCDAPDASPGLPEAIREEMRERRLYLGEGGIDIVSILARIPSAIYGLEIPNLARLSQFGPVGHATRCLETAKSYFAGIREDAAS